MGRLCDPLTPQVIIFAMNSCRLVLSEAVGTDLEHINQLRFTVQPLSETGHIFSVQQHNEVK